MDNTIINSSRTNKAIELHKNGYNCAQAVFAAYADLYNIDEMTALKLSTSFGGGLGGMRHICGAISGMAMIIGLEIGTSKPNDKEGKVRNYEQVKLFTSEFEKEHGSIICSELLGLKEATVAIKKKPCREYINFCAKLIEGNLLSKKDKTI